jgi:hypothetical protein
MPFDDNIPNMLVILCQCACGKEWYKKQHETARYEKYLRFKTLKPVHSLSIPYSLINSNNHFHQSDEITRDLLILERKRIVEMMNDFNYFQKSYSYRIVEECILYQEDIV